jgi:voltage-gated potassium channel
MRSFIRKNPFVWLTLAMIGLLMGGAYSREAPDSLTVLLVQVAGTALLLLSLLSLNVRQKWPKLLLVIVGLMVLITLVRHSTDQHHLDYFYLLLFLAFLLCAAWLVGGHVLWHGSVDLNKLMGAVSLYLMLGLIWSVVYTIVLVHSPGAFHGIEPGNWQDNLAVTTYFSFVTLTTLGYGDIAPATPMAEVLVILEAIVGMFYLAIVVASLVGAMIARRHRK